MNTILPGHLALTCLLSIMQIYLLVYAVLSFMRRIKLLKRPYSGMDYAESVHAAGIILGAVIISSASVPSLFQAVQYFANGTPFKTDMFLYFFARSFMAILFFSLLLTALSFLHNRFLFHDNYLNPSLPVAMILTSISLALAVVCWFACHEIIDSFTPKSISFQ